MEFDNKVSLKIGNLEICPPIIQGGMGVKVSGANLAAAVANAGCAGVIATAGLGQFEEFGSREFAKINEEAMRQVIREAKKKTDGIIGVNIMVALADHENLAKAAMDEGVDLIISGAGLPLNLPEHLNGRDVKLIPIVSSARTLGLICRRWKKQYNKLPDAVIVEGVEAGGHLGYSYESIVDGTAPSLEETVTEVLEIANTYSPPIPVIAAGGIFDGDDIAHFLKLGASGVQMATRFVCTDECDVDDDFKQAYINARPEDITIIQSPVGLPGRVISNKFVENIKQGENVPFKCRYQCLRSCKPENARYCIASVLAYASRGELDRSFAFAGTNAHRCNEIIPVKTLVEKLGKELAAALKDETAKNR